MNREGHSDRSERVTVPGGQFLSELAKWFAPEAAEELRAAGYNVDDIPREAAEVRFVAQDEAGNVDDISQAAEVCKIKDGQAFWSRVASRTGVPITARDNFPPELILEHATAQADGVRDLARIDERARAEERRRIAAEEQEAEEQKRAEEQKQANEKASSTTSRKDPPGPRVVLRGPTKPALIDGEEVELLTPTQYRVVEAMLKAGKPRELLGLLAKPVDPPPPSGNAGGAPRDESLPELVCSEMLRMYEEAKAKGGKKCCYGVARDYNNEYGTNYTHKDCERFIRAQRSRNGRAAKKGVNKRADRVSEQSPQGSR